MPQSLYIDEFAAEGIMFEGASGPPDYTALSFASWGPELRELMLDYRRLSQFGVMVSDRSRGRVVRLLGRTIIRYDVGEEDVGRFQRGLELLAELYWATGARRVFLPVAGLGVLERPEDLARLRERRLRARDLTLMAFHPLGTARAAARPADGVVDGDLALHGVEGLHLADGSVVPSALGVNPQLTIMALATRLAFSILGRAVPDEPERASVPVAASAYAPSLIVSFLADPPLLYATGREIGRRAPAPARRPLAAATLALFWGVSIPLYLDQRWIGWFWRLLPARSGRDWMLNSGVLRLDPDGAGPPTHAAAALLFAVAYPLALVAGLRRGLR